MELLGTTEVPVIVWRVSRLKDGGGRLQMNCRPMIENGVVVNALLIVAMALEQRTKVHRAEQDKGNLTIGSRPRVDYADVETENLPLARCRAQS